MVKYCSLCIFLLFSMAMAQNQVTKTGNLFFDDFSTQESNWTDMAVWGFGVWQKKDDSFVSLNPADSSKNIYAAIPKFENAILNRDFSILFRYKPNSGSNYQFSIQVKQQGLNNYKIEFSKNGRISIVKTISGKFPFTLFQSEPGHILFDNWQWIRLIIRGENPLVIKCKVWEGQLSHEPDFDNAAVLDENPLKSENINIALTSVQEGGAFSEIDDFHVFSSIPTYEFWNWTNSSKVSSEIKKELSAAKKHFKSGELFAAEIILKKLNKHIPNNQTILNTLAIILAEKGQFKKAFEIIQHALEIDPDNKKLIQNFNNIWQGLAKNGFIDPIEKPQLSIQLDEKVYKNEKIANLKIGIPYRNQNNFSSMLYIKVLDKKNTIVDSQEIKLSDLKPDSFFLDHQIKLEAISDGTYKIVLFDSTNKLANTNFEVIQNEYQQFYTRFHRIQTELQILSKRSKTKERRNEIASLEVLQRKIKRYFADCDIPGRFNFYKEYIKTGIEENEVFLEKLKSNHQPFHHKKGQFLRGYFSEIDGSIQAYALFVPPKYKKEKFPLVINLHGYDPTFSSWEDNVFLPVFMPFATEKERYIVANPFGRGNTMYQKIGENDVLKVLQEVKRLYNIDENRIYLTGGSMGGGGTWHLGLAYADQFAAIAPIMGPTEFSFWFGENKENEVHNYLLKKNSPLFYAENAANLPVFCNHGVLDDIVPVDQSRKIVKRSEELGYKIKYVEHPEAAHGGFKPEMDYEIYDWFENKSRNPFPKKITLKCGDLKQNKSYWVQIDRFENLLKFATIRAETNRSNKIEIEAENVSQFTLEFPKEIFEIEKSIFVKVQKQKFEITGKQAQSFYFDQNWKLGSNTTKLLKINKFGPISDVFNSAFYLVYGTTGNENETKINKEEAERFQSQWFNWQHVDCRIKPDIEIDQNDISNLNLILLGNHKTNKIINQINDQLPIKFKNNSILIDNKSFTGNDMGTSFIYPNPINPEKYVVVLGGISWRGIFGITKRIGTDFDYVIFDSKTLGISTFQTNLSIDGTQQLCGFFDQNWQISEQYQWTGNRELRKRIKFRNVDYPSLDLHTNKIYLSDLEPQEIIQVNGLPEKDRSFWGQPFQIDGKAYDKGIGVFPNSEILCELKGCWKILSGIVSTELNPYFENKNSTGKMQFAIYGDNNELFVSETMGIESKPQPFGISIEGIKKIMLLVRTENWLPDFSLSGNWINMDLTR